MSPVYRQGEAYPHPYPLYYRAPLNVEGQPIWVEPREPYYCYRDAPQQAWPNEWGYNNYEQSPYWYDNPEGGYYFYGPKFSNAPPRFYESRDFGRDIRPVYVHPHPASGPGPYAYRPFHPSDQFRHPDEYPMRFVPVTYGPLEQPKPHCCGCPNHVCQPQTSPTKGIERKEATDGNSGEEIKTGSQNVQEFQGPIVWFPSDRRNRGSLREINDQNEEKERGPVYLIPANWSRYDNKPTNDGNYQKEKSPANWIPINWNRNDLQPVKDQSEEQEKSHVYGVPVISNRNDREREQEKKFPVYWVPVDSNSRPQGQQEDKKNTPFERNAQQFPVFWIPEGSLKVATPEEETKNAHPPASSEKDTKKTNGVDSRPVIVQEIGKEDGKQRPAETKKETKTGDIPVKRAQEEKPIQAQKTQEKKAAESQKSEDKMAENNKTSSPRGCKLPPVCLRVDPLPGKKKANGKNSSRSPSPPRKDDNNKNATSNVSVENVKRDAPSKVSDEVKSCKKDATPSAPMKPPVEVKKADERANLNSANRVEEKLNVQSKKAEVKKPELSRDQAALKIQSFYRGFRVRRLQPLRKLSEISKIRERVKEIKQQISSAELAIELSRDEKARWRVSETMMGLLLQLDTIQGLHPVVRDVRKSVAGELVQLQEKLETLVEEARDSSLQKPCLMEAKNNNDVTAREEKIQNQDKGVDAIDEAGKILVKSNIENPQDDNILSTDDDNENPHEKAHDKQNSLINEDKETLSDHNENVSVEEAQLSTENENSHEKAHEKQNSLDIEKINEDKERVSDHNENVSVEEALKMENPPSTYGEHVEENASLKKGAQGVSDNQESHALSMESGRDENVLGEGASIANNAELFPENIVVEKEAKAEPDNLKDSNSALPQELDVAIEKELQPLSTLAQEEVVTTINNPNGLQESTGENATIEEGEKVSVGMHEAGECGISKEKTAVYAAETNETENEKVKNTIAVETPEVKDSESNVESSSLAIPDMSSESNVESSSLEIPDISVVSGSHDGVEKAVPTQDNLSNEEVENILPTEHNLSIKDEFAAPIVLEIDKPKSKKTTEPATESTIADGLPLVTPKDDLRIQNEEQATKSSGIFDDMEAGASQMPDKIVMESEGPKNVHSGHSSESETNILKSEENWEQENEKLREMVEKLVEYGKHQMTTIDQLNDKIKHLESKLNKGKEKRKGRPGHLKLKGKIAARDNKNGRALGC